MFLGDGTTVVQHPTEPPGSDIQKSLKPAYYLFAALPGVDTELHYWMPMRRNVKFGEWDREFTDPDTEINWFNEGKDILEGRIRQLNTGVHWPEEPVSRFEHIVTNVEIVDVTGDEICVNSKFFCYQNRLQDEVNTWVGRREDLLRRDSETGFKIVKRKIILAQNVILPKVVNTFF